MSEEALYDNHVNWGDSPTPALQGLAHSYPTKIAAEQGTVDNVLNYLGGAVASAGTGLYNTGVSVSHILGSNAKEADVGDVLNALDMQDSAAYYQEHKTAVDGAGLVIGSIVPGLAGVKVFHMLAAGAKAGSIRSFLNLAPSLNAARDEAKAAMLVSDGMYSALNAQIMKAYSLGFAANAMDALAFETAAISVNYKAPAYSNATSGDLASNMFWNTVFGGTVGGAVFSASKTLYGLRKARVERDALTFGDRYVAAETGKADLAIYSLLSAKKEGTSEIAANTNKEIDSLVHEQIAGITEGTGHTKLSFGMASVLNNVSHEEAVGVITGMEKITSVATLRGIEAAQAKIIESNDKLVQEAIAAGKPTPTLRGVPDLPDVRIVNLETGIAQADLETLTPHLGDALRGGEKLIPIAGRDIVQLGKSGAVDASYSYQAGAEALQAGRYLIASGKKAVPTSFASDEIAYLEHWAQQDMPKSGLVIDGVHYATPEPVMQKLLEVKREIARTWQGGLPELKATLNVTDDFLADGVKGAIAVPADRMASYLENPLHAVVHYNPEVAAMGKYNLHEATQYFENVSASVAAERENLHANFAADYGLKGGDTLPGDNLTRKVLVASAATGADHGAGTFSAANAGYGTFGAMSQKIGAWSTEAISTVKAATAKALSPAIAAVRGNENVGRELILLRNKLAGTESNYVVITPDLIAKAAIVGETLPTSGLVRNDLATYIARAAEAKQAGKRRLVKALDNSTDDLVIKTSPELHSFNLAQAELNATRRGHTRGFNASAGFTDVQEHEAYGLLRHYNIPIDTRKYGYFAIASQREGLGQTSHKSVITAASEEDLIRKIRVLQNDPELGSSLQFHTNEQLAKKYNIYFKQDVEGYHKALGDYEYARGMNENVVDSAMRRKGMLATPDELVNLSSRAIADAMDDVVNWNSRMDSRLVRDAIESRFSNTIQQLQILGGMYEKAGQSFMGNATSYLFANKSNPYADQIRQMLAISRKEQVGLWHTANEWVERGGSTVFGKAAEMMRGVVAGKQDFTAAAAELKTHLEQTGIGAPFSEAMFAAHHTQIAQRPVVGEFINRGQFYLSSMTLGLDPLNAINNAISQVMLAGELRSLTSAIAKGNPEVAGELARITLPNGLGSVAAPAMLMSKSLARFWVGGKVFNYETGQMEHNTAKQLLEKLRDHSIVAEDMYQQRLLAEEFMNSANATPGKLRELSDKALELGRGFTGNNLAERFTRFMAADTARQLTDLAAAQGIIKSEAEAAVYWNTTANRAQGVIMASQRPTAFQGPIGQAIGLYMNFQFNMMQQLARYIGTGDSGAALTAMTAQTALFGLQGLPAFNAINTHLIGNKEGNPEHKDLYSATPEVLGKTAGDLVLYGVASNALGIFHPDLKVNLYTRGDINPRQLTVIPTALDETPIYKATANFISQGIMAAENLSNGAPAKEVFLQALAHNGVSRPLAGVASVMQGAETSNSGNLLVGIDRLSIASFMRMAGGKPLDSALANDALYRMQAYAAHDGKVRKEIARAMKLDIRGGDLTQDELDSYMMKYASAGGKIDGFNQWAVRQYRNATTAQVNQFAGNQDSSLSANMRAIMGDDSVLNYEQGE